MAARKRRHVLAGVDGDEEAGTVTYHYDVVYEDEAEDGPVPPSRVIRSYSKVVKV